MGKAFIQEETLQAIAGAIREKNGSSDTYTPLQMVTAIENIPTGGTSGPDYLCFVANNPGVKLCLIGLNSGESAEITYILDVEYSTDKENWTTLEFNDVGNGWVYSDTITFTNIGDCVYFRGDNPNGTASMKDGYIYFFAYPYFSDSEIPKTNEFSVYGSVGSLKDKTGENVNGGAYALLFSDYNYLVGGDTSYQITSAPSLPSNTEVLGLYLYTFAGQDLLKQPARMYPFESLTVNISQAFGYMYSGCDLANTAILPKLQLPDDYTDEDIFNLIYDFQGTFSGKMFDGQPTVSQSIITTDNGVTLKPIPSVDFPLMFNDRYYDTWLFATQVLMCNGGFEMSNIHLDWEGDDGYIDDIGDYVNCYYHGQDILSDGKCWIPTDGSSTLTFEMNSVPSEHAFAKWQVSYDEGSTWTDVTTSTSYEVVLSSTDDFYIKAVFEES